MKKHNDIDILYRTDLGVEIMFSPKIEDIEDVIFYWKRNKTVHLECDQTILDLLTSGI